MDNLAFTQVKKQIADALGKYNNIGIIVGKNPNLDSMASALSLYLSISGLNKTASVISVDEPTVELSHLVGINKLKTNFEGDGGDLTVSFPYREGEIEKASYTLENGYLNIIIKASEQGLSFNERDIRFTRSQGAPELLFIIGSSGITDLGKIFDPSAFKNTLVVNIDNKKENQGFGDIVLASPNFSSISEIIANLIQSLVLKVDQDIAQNLMQGIQDRTGNFQNPNTTPLAFESAGFLIRNGASRQAYDQSLTSAFAKSTQAVPNEASFSPSTPTFQPEAGEKQESIQKIDKIERKEKASKEDQSPPEEWLTPKIYKGSTNF